MKLLITGGAGFIGSHVADAAISAGYKVAVVDDLSSGRRENLPPQAQFYQLDINSPELKDIFAQEAPDYICHQAAQIDIRKSVEDPLHDARINILGSINLLQLAVEYKVKKIVFASTGGAIYGQQQSFPATEKHPCGPLSPYGICKLAVEKYLYYYYLTYGLSYLSLRYANVYGPRQDPHGEAGVVAIFTQKMLSQTKALIFRDGEQTRDYVYVGDVVRANLAALKSDYNGALNIGTARETTVNQLFHALQQLIGNNADPSYAPPRPGEQQRSVICPQKAKQIMGWEPRTTLKQGLAKTVDFFIKQNTA